ncbi:MAG: head-tail adaptor protein [Alphaproteobacteria bacterium]|nr:head-tail adaptor protein [Alphaproteobacteria bacterium]
MTENNQGIGALRHALRLQNALKTPDGGGGWHTVWQDAALHPLVYAAIETAGGGEKLQSHRLEENITRRLRIRARADIGAGMRLVDTAAHIGYEIISVRPAADDGRFLWLETTVRPL